MVTMWKRGVGMIIGIMCMSVAVLMAKVFKSVDRYGSGGVKLSRWSGFHMSGKGV